MAGFFSVYKATGLLFGVLLWLTAGRAAAEALPLSPPEAAGAPFLRFSLSDPVDQWDGSATADFFLWDGDRPVPKEEIDVLAAVCRCRAEEETHVLPLTVREEEENAASFLLLTYGGRVGIHLGSALPCFSCPYINGCGGYCFLLLFQQVGIFGLAAYDQLFTYNGLRNLMWFLVFAVLCLLFSKLWCGWKRGASPASGCSAPSSRRTISSSAARKRCGRLSSRLGWEGATPCWGWR